MDRPRVLRCVAVSCNSGCLFLLEEVNTTPSKVDGELKEKEIHMKTTWKLIGSLVTSTPALSRITEFERSRRRFSCPFTAIPLILALFAFLPTMRGAESRSDELPASIVPAYYAGHYYALVSAPLIHWRAADVAAQSLFYLGLEGHLVTLTTPGENAFVAALIGSPSEYWAGGYQTPGQRKPRRGWTWVHGEGAFPGTVTLAPFANWYAGQPDDFYGPGSEQYLAIGLYPGWNDEGKVANIAGYVVEFELTLDK